MASTLAAEQTNSFFGWDLLHKTIESQLNKKADFLIAFAHFTLAHSNFRCLGIGEDKTLSDEELGSELLPDAWNSDDDKYALRYVFNNQLYLLLGHIINSTLIINLLDVTTKQVSNIGLDPEELVKATKGPITILIPNASQLSDRYRRELIDPVWPGTTKETTTQTTTTMPQERARTDFHVIPERFLFSGNIAPRPFGFPDVGRGDLDPLGRLGPGNIFELPSRFNLQGARPRFDPYGPPDFNIRPNPNPDHLQPPNFGGQNYIM